MIFHHETARGSPKRRSKTPPDFFSPDVAKAQRFYLDLDPPKDVTLAVICGGLEHSTPAYAIHRSTFPFYSIEYVARGRGELELKGRRYPLQPGRLFSYGPGIAHHITGCADEPLVKYFVDLARPGTLVKQAAEQTGFEDPFHFSRVFKRVFGLSPDGFHRLRPSPPPRFVEWLAPTRMPKAGKLNLNVGQLM